jgi:quercetin dioxygenase-like cupin family protein
MRESRLVFCVIVLMATGAYGYAQAAEPVAAPAASDTHLLSSPKDTKWGSAPPMVPPGAQVAVIDGDPFKEGAAYTLRLKMPKGYRVPPHFHPPDENLTEISGVLGVGMGDKFDTASGHDLNAGGFARMPQGMHHYAWAKSPAVVQVHGIGPFAFTYVNPADDPRNKH